MKKLFCLAYIKVFRYKFIHILKEEPVEFEENKIIEAINGKKNTELRKMIKPHLYKIVFNINGKDINNMKNEKINKRFKLNKFTNFEEFIGKKEIFLTNLLLPSENLGNKYFEDLFFKLKSYEKDNFKEENNGKNEIKKNIAKYREDMSYLIYSNVLEYI